MTNEEAIRILESMKSEMLLVFDHDRKEALKLAITALRAQNVPDTNVVDTISRQAAIDALGEKPLGDTDWDLGCRNQWEWDTEILKTMPSAQRTGKWIRNNDSDHAWKCSICGCGYTDCRLNYCYDCGADMKGESDGEIH